MKIKRLKIDWAQNFDNVPTIQVLVDEIPTIDEYTNRHPYYFGEKDGFVSFYYYDKLGDGYAGRKFILPMVGGGEAVLHGPRSSNPAAMRNAGFPDTIEVSITADPDVFKRGHTYFAGTLLFEVVEEAMRTMARGCVFATVGGSRTIIKRKLLPHLFIPGTVFGEPDFFGAPDLSDEQNLIVGLDYAELEQRVAATCGTYAEFWGGWGRPRGWSGCSLPLDHEGNHSDYGGQS